MRVFIELDEPSRDLVGICQLTKLIFRNQNINSVHIISKEDVDFDTFLKNKFDISIFGQPRTKWIFYSKLSGSKVVLHETEGLPYDINWIFHSVSKRLQRSIDEVWLWGKKQKQYIDNNSRLRCLKNKTHVTGSIRYENYKSRKKTTGDKLIQLNTNFPVLSPRYRSLNEELKQYTQKEFLSYNKNFLIDLLDSSGRRERLIYFFANCLNEKNFKGRVRPHPFESKSYYQNHKKFKNLEIDYMDSTDIHEDLSDCFACINSGCQTTLDCIFRGVIPISAESNGNFWDQYSLNTNEFIDIEDLYINKEKYLEKIKDKLAAGDLSDYICNLNEDLSIDARIARLVSTIKKNSLKKILLNRLNKTRFIIDSIFFKLIRSILISFNYKFNNYKSKIEDINSSLIKVNSIINDENLTAIYIGKSFVIKRSN